MNSNVVHQHSLKYGSNSQFEKGRRAPEFEPLTENEGFESGNGEIESGYGEFDTKNNKTHDNRTANKENLEPAKKYSNHIEFIDYIPTHEVITYPHLFA